MAVPLRAAVVNWRDLDHSLAGGSERYAWEFARALVEAGYAVEFITARDSGQSANDTLEGIDIRRAGGQYGFYLHAAWALWRRRRAVSVVVDPSCGIPTFSPLFLRRGTPVIAVMHHVHQDQFATYFPWPVAKFGQWLEGWLMPRVYHRTKVVAVSDSTATEMQERLGWRDRPEILANGADLGEPELLASMPGRLVVLGRLVRHKRVDAIIRALVLLVAAGHDLTLDVVGKGPDGDRIGELVGELGVHDRVRLHGYLSEEDKVAVVRQAQVHVCASDAEGWGQVVIEAAGLGVPTLARDVPGLRDSVVPGVTGWLLPDSGEDRLVAALVAGIEQALVELATPSREQNLRAESRRWASQFSWEHMRSEARRVVAEELHRGEPSP